MLAMALVAWPTADANSYSSREDADTYFADRLDTTVWDAATDENKDKALITATRLIDRETWQGEKTEADQPLAFPRSGLSDQDGNALPDDELPELFLQGFWELALQLLTNSKLVTQTTTAGNIQSVRAGSAGVTYFSPTQGSRWPDVVQNLLGIFMASGNSYASTGGEAFGTGRDPAFSECGDFKLNGGL